MTKETTVIQTFAEQRNNAMNALGYLNAELQDALEQLQAAKETNSALQRQIYTLNDVLKQYQPPAEEKENASE